MHQLDQVILSSLDGVRDRALTGHALLIFPKSSYWKTKKSGFNLGTCLVNSGEPRAGVEQLLKILSLLPDNEENADKVNTQTLYYNLGIGLAYVGEWSTCFSVLGTNFSCSDLITGTNASYDVRTLSINGNEISPSNSNP